MADYKFFRPKPGRFGVMVSWLAKTFGTITANTTSTMQMGAPPRRSYIEQAQVSTLTVPVDSDGGLTLVLKKWDASAGAAVTLTAATNLETLTTKVARLVPILATLSASQRTFEQGDTLYAEAVSDSAAIDTPAVDLVVSVDFAVLE